MRFDDPVSFAAPVIDEARTPRPLMRISAPTRSTGRSGRKRILPSVPPNAPTSLTGQAVPVDGFRGDFATLQAANLRRVGLNQSAGNASAPKPRNHRTSQKPSRRNNPHNHRTCPRPPGFRRIR
jgi:hypothetical protein